MTLDFSALKPSEADFTRMREKALARARSNRTCFTHWFPVVESLSLRAPRSLVIDFPPGLTAAIADGDASVKAQLQDIAQQIRAFGEETGYPLFLKNSLSAVKHEWKDTCFIESADVDIAGHIENLTYSWMVLSGDDALYLVVREMIPTAPAFHAFDGRMPIAAEFRLFATDGKLNGWQPYWPAHAIQRPSAPDWQKRLKAISIPTTAELAEMQTAAEAVTRRLGGYWSVDFLKDRCGNLWLIDMAEGEKSFRCEVGYRSAKGLNSPSQSDAPSP